MKTIIFCLLGAILLAQSAHSFATLHFERSQRHLTSIFKRSTNSQRNTMSRRQDQTKLQVSEESSENKTSSSHDNNTAWLLTLCLPLWLVYVSNQWSRASIYYLVDFSDQADSFKAMNIDIGFSQAQYGLLASIAFTALYAIASLGAGVVRANRASAERLRDGAVW